ncbi:hypothetical protein MK489_16835 [Myxococcota bacterium]|nr:hypothetical protein [Myxococcota bacterium]
MRLKLFVFVLLLAPAALAESAGGEKLGVGVARETFVDSSRPTKASSPFQGAPSRRLDTWIWYPAAIAPGKPVANAPVAEGGPWPLIVYSHGTYGQPDNATHFVHHLVKQGYVVAAPAFPLTSRVSHTQLPAADISDAENQPADVSFVIDSLLAHPRFGPVIDADQIGATGISLGGITTYFASFGVPTLDPRIKASAPIAPGDPPVAALGFGLGFKGTVPAPVSVPAMLLVGDADIFSASTGGPGAAYARLWGPKYMVEIRDAPHVWFGDRDNVPPDNLNPDCVWFEEHAGMIPPLCAQRRPLIDPERQKVIVRTALEAFFDGYLKNDARARAQLGAMGGNFEEVTLHHEPAPES